MECCNGLISKNLTNPNEKIPKEPRSCCTISLLEGEELFLNRLLSRDSSKGFSSRIYYRVAGKVPFEWEMQPGKPKITLECAPLLPLSPPPAALSTRLAPLRCNHPASKGSTGSRLWFWKKKATKVQKSQSQDGSEESFESWSCEGDSMTSSSFPRNSSSSSSSFGSRAPRGKPPGPESRMRVKGLSKRRGVDGLDWVWSCSPWGFSGVMVCMLKGV